MHPQIIQDQPGACPICGMDLVKKNHAAGDSLAATAELKALLEPTNTVVVANIATVQPQRRSESIQLQASGIVTYDTRRLYTIPARFGGRIEKMYVRYAYQPIRKGQKLLELYSPDLVTAQREFLYLLSADAGNAALITAAKQKLRLLGVTDSQLADLARSGKPSYSLAVFSPYNGYIANESAGAPTAVTPAGTGMGGGGMNLGGESAGMGSSMSSGGTASGVDEITFSPPAPSPGGEPAAGSLLLREGQYVQTGQTLFRVVNPSRLWAEFRLYARDAAHIRPGDGLTIRFDQTNQPPLPAKVSFVVPFLENGSQFVTIRAYLPGNRAVRVGQLARAVIRRSRVEGLWIPATAVLDLGNEQVAFVQQQPSGVGTSGIFRPVRVQTGAQADGYVSVTGGLTSEQVIARNAQFLIDSESFVNPGAPKQEP
ncbi:hypothetical protein GCM10023189_45370 [Nibrella saemangeumensis]|uniref:Uncharacterized protein n=2 Tax=Nibrella saemangeumensis TaxID=1084526 RepID=A0ABP8NCQ8_9BACT